MTLKASTAAETVGVVAFLPEQGARLWVIHCYYASICHCYGDTVWPFEVVLVG